MSYSKLYDESWEHFKKEMFVKGLGPMIEGELITEYLSHGYYLLKLHSAEGGFQARFDHPDGNRFKLDLYVPVIDLAQMYSFGKICRMTVWKGTRKQLSQYLSGEFKEMLSNVRGVPEPGVYMVSQDGLTYFVGTTIYFNVKDLVDIDKAYIDTDRILHMVNDVLGEIDRIAGVD